MRLENESIQPSHKNYKEYKTQFTKNKKQTFMMFISIFFVLLLIFLGFARLMSPDVDISIGDDNNSEYGIFDDFNLAGSVDNRLKALQDEDEGLTSETKTEDGGLVKIPEHKKAETSAIETNEDSIKLEEAAKPETTIRTQEPESAPVPQAAPSITARVVVGSYATQAQAEVARGILQEAGLGVNPHIRQMGGTYTLQVGAYSSKDAANNLANKLLMNNYPARVIVENN